jgi:hypothetical protein
MPMHHPQTANTHGQLRSPQLALACASRAFLDTGPTPQASRSDSERGAGARRADPRDHALRAAERGGCRDRASRGAEGSRDGRNGNSVHRDVAQDSGGSVGAGSAWVPIPNAAAEHAERCSRAWAEAWTAAVTRARVTPRPQPALEAEAGEADEDTVLTAEAAQPPATTPPRRLTLEALAARYATAQPHNRAALRAQARAFCKRHGLLVPAWAELERAPAQAQP